MFVKETEVSEKLTFKNDREAFQEALAQVNRIV
jgi:hypothetical protein